MSKPNIGIKEAQVFLKTAAHTIRTQASEIEDLREKVASYETGERIVKIAKDMQEKGLSEELSHEEKVASLQQRVKDKGARSLDVTEEAVKLAAPQSGVLGGPSDRPGSASSEETFMTFIMTGEDTR